MKSIEYQRLTLKQMQQRRWKTARELRNGSIVVPEGLVVEIDKKRNGLTLIAPRCAHCGVRVIISHCSPGDVVEVLDAQSR